MSRIAISQLTARNDFDANLAHALEHVREAHGLGARLLAFPEVFLYVGGRSGKLAHALDLDGGIVARFRDEAARTGMMILLGSFHERIEGDPEHVHNTSVLIGADGELLAVYRKINLFYLDLPNLKLRESDTIRAGRTPPPVTPRVPQSMAAAPPPAASSAIPEPSMSAVSGRTAARVPC